MERDLHLSSPFMRGKDVLYAQRLLLDNNWNLDLEVGKRTVYDEKTAVATKRAKFLLGYPTAAVNETFGDKLELYLRDVHPHKNIPLAYRLRRRSRLKQLAKSQTLRALALVEAGKWLGTKEHPAGSNRVSPFGPWYRNYVGPWCAVFASWCYSKAGSKSVVPGSRWAFVPFMVNDARHHVNGLRELRQDQVEPGDLVMYDWQHDGTADHVGLFKEWLSHDTFIAREGNTAIGNDSNGGEVMERERSVFNVACWARVER